MILFSYQEVSVSVWIHVYDHVLTVVISGWCDNGGNFYALCAGLHFLQPAHIVFNFKSERRSNVEGKEDNGVRSGTRR